jgi:hypothetical protein
MSQQPWYRSPIDQTDMSLEHAVQVCEDWFHSIEERHRRAELMSQAAAAAKQGDRTQAMRLKAQAESIPLAGMDGAKLEPAVRCLLRHLSK